MKDRRTRGQEVMLLQEKYSESVVNKRRPVSQLRRVVYVQGSSSVSTARSFTQRSL